MPADQSQPRRSQQVMCHTTGLQSGCLVRESLFSHGKIYV